MLKNFLNSISVLKSFFNDYLSKGKRQALDQSENANNEPFNLAFNKSVMRTKHLILLNLNSSSKSKASYNLFYNNETKETIKRKQGIKIKEMKLIERNKITRPFETCYIIYICFPAKNSFVQNDLLQV